MKKVFLLLLTIGFFLNSFAQSNDYKKGHAVGVSFFLNDFKAASDIKSMGIVNLLKNQLTWCNSNKEAIKAKAAVLYKLIQCESGNDNFRIRCCDFGLLIEKSKEYVY